MPFDGAGFATDDRLSKIDQVIDLLATPDRWCKAAYRTPEGRFCIRGAMRASKAENLLNRACCKRSAM